MSQMMMKCKLCQKTYLMEDPIRRTCGGHSEPSAIRGIQNGDKFLATIKRNFQNPNYQNHSIGILRDDAGERYYTQIWWGF